MVELATYIPGQPSLHRAGPGFYPNSDERFDVPHLLYPGLDPFTMKPVHVPRGHEKRVQRALTKVRAVLDKSGFTGAKERIRLMVA